LSLHCQTHGGPRRPSRVAILILISLLLGGVTGALAQDEAVVVDSILIADAEETLAAQNVPAPAIGLSAKDTPNDAGGAIRVTWGASPDDVVGGKVRLYRVFRADEVNGQAGEFAEVGDTPAGSATYRSDDGNTDDDKAYFYRIQAVNIYYDADAEMHEYTTDSETFGPVTSSAQWFNSERIKTFFGTILLSFFIIFFIHRAQSGKKLFIRKMAGMEAVDEAVGRATEMGKKIFYITGLGKSF